MVDLIMKQASQLLGGIVAIPLGLAMMFKAFGSEDLLNQIMTFLSTQVNGYMIFMIIFGIFLLLLGYYGLKNALLGNGKIY